MADKAQAGADALVAEINKSNLSAETKSRLIQIVNKEAVMAAMGVKVTAKQSRSEK